MRPRSRHPDAVPFRALVFRQSVVACILLLVILFWAFASFRSFLFTLDQRQRASAAAATLFSRLATAWKAQEIRRRGGGPTTAAILGKAPSASTDKISEEPAWRNGSRHQTTDRGSADKAPPIQVMRTTIQSLDRLLSSHSRQKPWRTIKNVCRQWWALTRQTRNVGQKGPATPDALAAHGIHLCHLEAVYFWQELEIRSSHTVGSFARLQAFHFSLLITATILVFFLLRQAADRLATPVETLRQSFSTANGRLPPLDASSTGICELDELHSSYVKLSHQIQTEGKIHERYVETISKVFQLYRSLHENVTEHTTGEDVKLETALCQILQHIGKQLPNLSLAKILTCRQDLLVPGCPTYISPSFRTDPAYVLYRSSLPVDGSIRAGDGISGWAYVHAAIELRESDGQQNLLSKPHPATSLTPFRLAPSVEQGLTGSILAIHLRHPRGQETEAGECDLLFLYFHDPNTVLNPSEMMFLLILTQQISALSETARLVMISRQEQELTRQLAIAREIQGNTIPPHCPPVPGLRLDALVRMAYQVGGDYYDFLPFRDGRVGIVVADVSGKNLPSALLTMVLKTIFKALRIDLLSPSQVLAEVNRILIGIISESYFVTMVYAIIDPVHRTVCLSNAGHTPALLRTQRNGATHRIIELEVPGYPLGVIHTSFQEVTFSIKKGDALLFATDGVIDCLDARGSRFGNARLTAFFEAQRGENLAHRLAESLDRFRGATPPPDDITIVTVEYLGETVSDVDETATSPSS
jgi:serine phosphatase RsbU (regulator of sigma subunit)